MNPEHRPSNRQFARRSAMNIALSGSIGHLRRCQKHGVKHWIFEISFPSIAHILRNVRNTLDCAQGRDELINTFRKGELIPAVLPSVEAIATSSAGRL